jgi:PAS domain S-box-containing protein
MPGVIFQTEYDKDFNAKFNYISPKAKEFTGFTVEELMEDYTRHLSSIHPEDLPLFNKARENIYALKSFNVKYRYIDRVSSETKWVRVTAIPSRLSNGNIIVNGILLDISEIEKNYTDLEESNQRYEYISKASNEAIWEINFKADEIFFGGDYEKMFGISFPGNKSKMPATFHMIHPEDAERVINEQKSVIENKEKYWESQYRHIRPDGSHIYLNDKAFVIYDEKTNKPLKVIGTTQDITQIKLAEMEKEKIISDLLRRNKALEEFTYMVSHNIRAPLANIMGLTAMLEDENIDAESKSEISKMAKISSERLDEVIRDINEILNISRSLHEKKENVSLAAIVEDVKSIEKNNISGSGVKIDCNFEKAENIFAVKNHVLSIFQHLINNAIKFKSEISPHLKIISEIKENYIYLKFEDNGIGFDSDINKNKVFVLYNKFHPEKEGKGMGLFIVKKHVENLGGEITVESTVNKGTKFLIKIKKT